MFLNIGPQHPATHGVLRLVRAARRRGDRRRRARHRLPPPRRGEDGRAPDLAHLHPLHGPHRLPGRPAEQLPLRAGRGEARRHRGARARPGDPHHDGGALPHHQPPRLLRHLQRATWGRCPPCSGCSPTASAPSTSWRRSPAAACTRRGSASAAWRRTCPTGWDTHGPGLHRATCASGCKDYDVAVMKNRIVKARTVGIGVGERGGGHRVGRHGTVPAGHAAWTGTCARRRPYGGYEQFEFDVPTADARGLLRQAGRPRGGDAPEPAHHRAVPEQHARRAVQVATIPWPPRRARSARCTTSRRSSTTSSA